MSTHTPGPWRVSECQLGSKLLIEHGNEETVSPIIGAVYTDGGRLPQQANAALIAAAPEMLESLKELSRLTHQMNARQHAGIGNEPGAWGELYRVTNDARATIAKAEGRG